MALTRRAAHHGYVWIVLLVIASACGSGGTRIRAGRGGVLVDEPLPRPTIVLQSIQIRDLPDGTLLEVAADAPLAWTSYRNAGGDFVLELADTVPGPDLATTLTPSSGIIERVSVDLQDMLRRSPLDDTVPPKNMTRITVLTRRDAVHALRSANQTLSLTFTPVAGTSPRPIARQQTAPRPVPPPITSAPIASEPLPRVTPPATATTPLPPSPKPPTPPATQRAPMPAGHQLLGATVENSAHGRVIHLLGDGSFTATSFFLSTPPRFVIDLPGVRLTSATRTVVVAAGGIARVRLGQFQRIPPIARAVLDLDNPSVAPHLEPVADGLLIHLPANP